MIRNVTSLLLTLFEAAGIAATLLVLPCALIDAVFGTDLISLLALGVLLLLAGVAIVAVAPPRQS